MKQLTNHQLAKILLSQTEMPMGCVEGNGDEIEYVALTEGLISIAAKGEYIGDGLEEECVMIGMSEV